MQDCAGRLGGNLDIHPCKTERRLKDMNMFEYYGYFREEYETDCLTKTESKIIRHLFDKYLPAEGRVLDSSAGFGTFAFDFAERGYKVVAGDLIADHVEQIKADSRFPLLEDVYCASPRNLSQFADGSFDIVISLGPMYHFKTNAERAAYVRESLRVLSPEGYFAFTFMTPFAMTLGQYFNAVRTYDNRDKLKAFRKLAQVEKSHNCDMFIGLDLDDISDIAREHGMEILTVASTYGMLYNMTGEVEGLNEEEYNNFVNGQIATCEDAFIARYCMRGLVICKKRNMDMFDSHGMVF